MKSILKPVAVLTVICLIITAAVAGINLLTEEKIAENDKISAQKTMSELIACAEFSAVTADGAECSEIYSASDSTGDKGYIFVSSAFGYGGQVRVMTAVGTDGSIIGVRVLSCSDETPGLGQNAKNAQFTDRFTGLSTSEQVNGADAITSATFTSNAVKKSINCALHDFKILTGGEQN